jgi:hypothetical protein
LKLIFFFKRSINKLKKKKRKRKKRKEKRRGLAFPRGACIFGWKDAVVGFLCVDEGLLNQSAGREPENLLRTHGLAKPNCQCLGNLNNQFTKLPLS